MALNPDHIQRHTFGSSLRGFDRNEVKAYLERVAQTVRELEEEVRSAKAKIVPEQLAAPVLSDEDRFGALGERIASLLRNAHESAAQVRAGAEAEVAQIKSDAHAEVADSRAEVERLQSEADGLRTTAESEASELRLVAEVESNELKASAEAEVTELRTAAEAEAVAIRASAESEGAAALDDRRSRIEANELEIEQNQASALADLSDAREQVSELLEQARAQSEFIRLEADDIIREKIRANMEAAEGRLTVLRNTEEVSRERIRLAQSELSSAMERLESEPAPTLPEGTEDLVLEEAEQRSIEAGYGVSDSSAEFIETADEVQTSDDDADYQFDSDGEAEYQEDVAADEDQGYDEVLEAGVVCESEVETLAEDSDDSSAADSDEDADDEPVFGAAPVVEASGDEPDGDYTSANDEDALARLVREAMQSAVDTARTRE